MRKGLLLSVSGVLLVVHQQAYAACTPALDCAELVLPRIRIAIHVRQDILRHQAVVSMGMTRLLKPVLAAQHRELAISASQR